MSKILIRDIIDTDKKVITICSNTSWYIYNFRAGLIEALQKKYRVVLIAPKDDYSNRLKILGCEYHNIEIDNKGTNPINDMKLMYSFYRLYREIKPDMLLIYTIKPNIYGGMVSKLLNIPTLNVIAGLGTVFLNDNISSKLARGLYKTSLYKNRVLFENEDDCNEFLDKNLVKQEQVRLIPGSGINTELFQPKVGLVGDDSSMVFLLIARLIKDKGIVEYIEAIESIRLDYPEVKFKLLGSYYEGNPSAISKDEVNRWVEDGTVEYLGYTDAVLEEIQKADCIVLPSYREGLSRVLLEAASMSKPIITTDVTGCRDVVNDGENGYLVPLKDSGALATAMEKMIALSKIERIEMGRKGRVKVINEFDEKIVIKHYLNIISSEL
ncbi:Lipid carrier : UDP-N-acetylgalactosaminyltransferase / Alpha-1,3-N-acetylgalactosamine transferase PglA; Putative glycosyltransferase [hydrothermal vent metagenome]|uniref:Lipid carrier: UDP-N-acetylgalactosaminyltransferase / Alpha-1,3-N-acetylgalactosamine transferase PglA Putative glycosyltransferase n=1 Tax=hydrothermal vent metagenome TaxID=652676 RepID=A0A1W1CEZ8_9ZZZZ